VGIHAPLVLLAVACAFPFYWLIVMATSSTSEIFTSPPRLIPGTQFFHNFSVVLANSSYVSAFFNSLLVTVIAVVVRVLLDSLAGFVFAKFRFPGRDKLFVILLLTMALPTGVSLVPSYEIYANLGWINTYLPLLVPSAVSAFGVFWMRQAASASIPDEIMEAARVDGAGFFRVYWSIALPTLRPTIAALGIFEAIWTWNDYLWPLLVLNDPDRYTIPLALQQLKGAYGATDYSVVMSGTLVAVIPLIVLFLIFRRTVMNNVVVGAVKG
jgi:cellobiose transport system permease protein